MLVLRGIRFLYGFGRGMEGLQHFPGPQLGGNRNGVHDPSERFDPRPFVDALVDNEADWAVGAGGQQHAVSQGKVVANEQGAALGGDVVAAVDADAVYSVRETPENEPQE